MEIFNVTNILEFGAMGFGFLLAYFCYGLIRAEQDRPEPREGILKKISLFMVLSVFLVGIGIVGQVLPSNDTKILQEQLKLEAEAREVAETQLKEVCYHVRTSDWLNSMPEARKSLQRDCPK